MAEDQKDQCSPRIPLKQREQVWDELKAKYEKRIAPLKGKPIKITLLDGSVVEGKSYETTPFDIAKEKKFEQHAIVSRVNGEVWDMGRPMEVDSKLEILKWENGNDKLDNIVREVFWHSSSHIFGEALEQVYDVLLCKGPPNVEEGGFYYEGFMGDQRVQEDEYKKIEQAIGKIVKKKQKFERIEIEKSDIPKLFGYNKFKMETLSEKVPEGAWASVYRCGDLIDPCKGPHLLHTGKVKGFKIVSNSASYWRADQNRESLQRVYGMSFPDKKKLKEWVKIQEELKKNHHKTIGKQQELWFNNEFAPGMFFFLPKGQIIFKNLLGLMRDQQRARGFQEVQTPNMFHSDLWRISGHWDKYHDDMFQLNVDKSRHCLKPMNCPAHCLMFKHRTRSYKELPIRFCDFGVLHRNELRGALGGMTRLRRFQQDDGHIFCAHDQIESEMENALGFMRDMYGLFGFEFKLHLSTRPEKYLGELETWNKAEEQLEKSLIKFGANWDKDIGGGAFYGPKIDITIKDSLKRSHQCATIQLDFQMPQRFDLKYTGKNVKEELRPVIIHRAIFGSLERFLAILTEHIKGKWPFWLSPRQIRIVPCAASVHDYAKEVETQLYDAGFHVDTDLTKRRIDKKVRMAQTEQYNLILVVGKKEIESKSVNVRVRGEDKELGMMKVDDLVQVLNDMKKTHYMGQGFPDEVKEKFFGKKEEQKE